MHVLRHERHTKATNKVQGQRLATDKLQFLQNVIHRQNRFTACSPSIGRFAIETQHIKILRADPGTVESKILCSNLRRAVSTLAVAFRDRLARRPDDKILIVPALQEISRNPDTLSITPAHTPLQASWIEKGYTDMVDFPEVLGSQTDVSMHTGNKPINTNGLKRMLDFCEYVYSPSVKETHVIVGGHSIWFRYFFPHESPAYYY